MNDSSAPAHEDHVVWAVYVALASASGPDGRGCHHTLRATARLVPDMLLLRGLRPTTAALVCRATGEVSARNAAKSDDKNGGQVWKGS